MSGWVKIHRKILEKPSLTRASILGLWVYLLLSVHRNETKAFFAGKDIVLSPGQGIFSTPTLSKILDLSVSKVRRILKMLENEQMIEQLNTPKGSVITVVNWNKYQNSEQLDEQQVNNCCTTGEQQVNNFPIYIKNNENKEKEENINNTNVLFVIPAEDEPQKSSEYQPIIDAWNSLPLQNIYAIRGKRLDSLRARIKEYGIDNVLNAISKIRNSPFLLGQNKHGWQIKFDWFIKPNNFPKVLEGNYDAPPTTPTGKNDVQAGYQKMMQILGGTNGETNQ